MADNVGMGEHQLLAKLRERLPASPARLRLGSGDDAAVTVPGGATATSIDAVVDGIHFRQEWSRPEQIGHKALATALSDLAAMGAEPGEAYIALGLPEELGEHDFLAILDGAIALARQTGTAMAGGDVVASPVLSLAVTVVGHAKRAEDFVSRCGAMPGDRLVVTGELGAAAAGLLVLDGKGTAPGGELAASITAELVRRQLEPQPRLAAGRALAASGARAMIDLSDGLGADAGHLADASAQQVRIELERLPVAEGLEQVAGSAGMDPVELAAGGGEDYELLAAIPPEKLDAAVQAVAAVGLKLTEIGTVAPGSGVTLRDGAGNLVRPTGFDQLAKQPGQARKAGIDRGA